jgi:Zn-dependent protease
MAFSGQIELFRAFGIPVKLHWTFSLLIFFIVGLGFYNEYSVMKIAFSVLYILATFFCITLHEFGHALAAHKYNIKTQDITIWPMGGIARLQRIPYQPIREFWIAVAGPLVNFGIALLLGLVLKFAIGYDVMPIGLFDMFDLRVTSLIGTTNFLIIMWQTNLLLAVFNLIPAFPMDGGRVLRALLHTFLSRVTATQVAVGVSTLLVVAALIYAFYQSDIMLAGVGIFIYFQSSAELKSVKLESQLAGHKIDVITQALPDLIEPHFTLKQCFNQLVSTGHPGLLAKQENQYFQLHADELLKNINAHGWEAEVHEKTALTPLLTISSHTPLNEARSEMIAADAEWVIVTNQDTNEVLGIAIGDRIYDFATIRQKLVVNNW